MKSIQLPADLVYIYIYIYEFWLLHLPLFLKFFMKFNKSLMLHLLWNCCKWNDPPFINSLPTNHLFQKNTHEFSPQPTIIAFRLLKFLPQDRSFLYFEQLRNSLFTFPLFSKFLHYFDYFKVPLSFTTT